jgi:hypothetical protein
MRIQHTTEIDEMIDRLRILGYRFFGVEKDPDPDPVTKVAKEKGLGCIVWRRLPVRLSGSECQLLQAGDKIYGLKVLYVPLSSDLRSVRRYVLNEKNKLDGLILSFKDVRELYADNPRHLFLALAALKNNLVGTAVPIFVCSDAKSKGELLSPQSIEGLLSIIYSRSDPLSISSIRKTLLKLEALSIS